MRLRAFGIVGRGFFINQVGDAGDLFVGREFIGLGRRGQRDLLAIGPYALEQLPYGRKGADLRQVARFEQVAAVGLDLISAAIEFFLGEEDRHELVAALADLRTHVGEGHLMAEMGEGFLPGFRVQVDRVDQGAVDVENDCSDQSIPFSADRSLFARQPCRGGYRVGGEGARRQPPYHLTRRLIPA